MRRPVSQSRIPPPGDCALEDEALPRRLTPICHCSSITEHQQLRSGRRLRPLRPPSPPATAGHARQTRQ